MRKIAYRLLLSAVLVLGAAAQVNPNLYAGLRWRMVGPFRAGRVAAVSGVIGRPGIFYAGLPAGGVWKTVSAGETWYPIFDSITSVSSVGAIEVAPSDPNIIYVGTGDLITGGAINEGDGMYKSTDAGKTWARTGLENTFQIPIILVDPKDPNVVLVAAQGNVHAASQDRGVYRSTDGGKTWKQTLFRADNVGVGSMAWAYDQPDTVLAITVAHGPSSNGAGGGGDGGRGGAADGTVAMYKSTDEGATWKEITGGGLPALSGRTGVAVAMNTHAQRMFLVGSFGLYRSDDGGASWNKSTDDTRASGSAYICDVYVDTKDPDIVYTMNTSTYRSTDGGKTFASYKGAPGGDDNHVMWIDPTDHERLIMGTDQGATISYDAGHTWSSWYNQPTAQVYKIAADNQYPYWIYASQQDSGSIATRERGDFGEVTVFDWWPLAGYEFGYPVPDPLDPTTIYAAGPGGGMVKIIGNGARGPGQWMNVAPNQGTLEVPLRKVTNAPTMFSPQDPHTLYYAFQMVEATQDGGLHWHAISPDLSLRESTAPPAAGGAAAGGGRGGSAIDSLAPSTFKAGVIWAGTNNGVVHVTQDGGTKWSDVTPPDLKTNSDVASIEASHFDAATAWAVVDRHTAGDYQPFVYRTTDFGKTWQSIVSGLPTDERSGSFGRVVREDPERKGLLFLGTESSMYVSFDNGDHWQSLRLNLPTTSYRDMLIHGDDLVVGTYGRSFWILDDISPLRQINNQVAGSGSHLFKPADALRVRYNVNGDTPLAPEVPHADNPPYGAILYYYLASKPTSVVKLEIFDSENKLVRTMTSAPLTPIAITPQAIPDYWMETPKAMSAEAGTNRVMWDMRYDRPPSFTHGYSQVDTVYMATPLSSQGPIALPGTYTAKLTVDGRSESQTFALKEDPRLPVTPALTAALKSQLDLELKVTAGMTASMAGYDQIDAMRTQLRALTGGNLAPEVAAASTALDAKLSSVQGMGGRGARGGGGGGRGAAAAGPVVPNFGAVNGSLSGMNNTISLADLAPIAAQVNEYKEYCGELNAAIAALEQIDSRDIATFNQALAKSNLQKLTVAPPPATASCGP